VPKITVEADTPYSSISLVTLTERIVAEHLANAHYCAQLIERIAWATADAEAAESQVDAEAPALIEAGSADRVRRS
jgi:hypothetical protein